MTRRDPSTYRISLVAERYAVHPQTLRMYEREGLLRPSRTVGNTRMYDEGDLRRLEIILHLTRELGVNLAGVEVILHMRDRMSWLQRELADLADLLRGAAEEQKGRSTALIPVPEHRLAVLLKRWTSPGL